MGRINLSRIGESEMDLVAIRVRQTILDMDFVRGFKMCVWHGGVFDTHDE